MHEAIVKEGDVEHGIQRICKEDEPHLPTKCAIRWAVHAEPGCIYSQMRASTFDP